ncbi:hypothetical protein O3P69_005922 [Scylla paramamosain]|uniref:Uncharacterized protein n=1 Tax=Scylla paramamosain TaxID=85552 RepID=A0AAW0U3X9_SCYPA
MYSLRRASPRPSGVRGRELTGEGCLALPEERDRIRVTTTTNNNNKNKNTNNNTTNTSHNYLHSSPSPVYFITTLCER